MNQRTALILIDFDLTRHERMTRAIAATAAINEMYLHIAKNGQTGGLVRLTNPTPFDKLIWDIDTIQDAADISNISAIFDALNLYKCDTMFCDVCEIDNSRYALYSYIRDLVRLCGINVVPMNSVRDYIMANEEPKGPEMLIGDPGVRGPEGGQS